MARRALLALATVGVLAYAPAEEVPQTEEMLGMTLDDLLNMKISVATAGQAVTERESPGIVTVITAREIELTGARDLTDVLELIPGFSIVHDIGGALGLSIRGTYATEGKVLFLVDGIEMNDELYLSFTLGQHIPIDNIERIEVIRGPGSAVYGGAAELGVISITTKQAKDKLDLGATVTAGRTGEQWARVGGTVTAGTKLESFQATGTIHYNVGNLSDQSHPDVYGTPTDFGTNDYSRLTNLHANVAASYKGLSARFILDQYQVNFPYPGYYVSEYYTQWNTYAGNIRYQHDFSEQLSMAPTVQVRGCNPWARDEIKDDDGVEFDDWDNDVAALKLSLDVPVSLVTGENGHIVAGLREDVVLAEDRLPKDHPNHGVFGEEDKAEYSNTSLYMEGTQGGKLGNFTLGVRFSYHNAYGISGVPRLAYTKSFGDMVHLKLLLSGALREPSVSNIAHNSEILPEKTWYGEAEIGLRPFDWWSLTVNGFGMEILDAIVYSWDDVLGSTYANYGQTQAGGVEVVSRMNAEKWFCNIAYSYSKILGNDIVAYTVPGVDDRNLGIPAHKLTIAGGPTLFDQLSIVPSMMLIGPRWGIEDVNWETDWSWNYEEHDAVVLLNLAVLWEVPWVEGLKLSVSGHNLLGQQFEYLQAYDGWDAPVPARSREAVGKLSYSF